MWWNVAGGNVCGSASGTRADSPYTCRPHTSTRCTLPSQRIENGDVGRCLDWVYGFVCQAKASEGEAYNIVSNSAKHDDKARVVDDRLMRTTLTRVHTDVERHVTASSLAAEVKGRPPTLSCTMCRTEQRQVSSCLALSDDARKIGRIAHRRFEQELQHGHDIISNKPFKGIDAKPTFSARATKPSVRIRLLVSRYPPDSMALYGTW